MNINDNFISEDGMGHFDGNGKHPMTLQVDVGAPLEFFFQVSMILNY